MSALPEYSSLPETGVVNLTDTPVQGRRSLASDASSDIVYRDALDIEPFAEDEKAALRPGGGGVSDAARYRDDILGAEGRAEEGDELWSEHRRLRPRKKSRKTLAALIGLVVFAGLVGSLAGATYSAPSYSVKGGNRRIELEHIFNQTFAVKTKDLAWVKEAPEGTFSEIDSQGNIFLSTVQNMTESTLLVNASQLRDETDSPVSFQSWQLSADMQYVLFRADTVKQWRHSSFGNYLVYRLKDKSLFHLTTPDARPSTSIAIWSPVGHSLAFVQKNDLYVVTASELASGKPKPIRVTTDGSPTVFNGVPDWVYEEEVFSADKALWWSPDGQTVAFLRSDETDVKVYALQYFNPGTDAFEVHQYPTELDMRYPKPGTPNPLVSVQTFSLAAYKSGEDVAAATTKLTWPGSLPVDQRIISEIGWVGDSSLMIKEVDRAARKGSVVIFQDGRHEGQVVRVLGKDGEESDGGWIDHGQNVVPVKSPLEGYIDIVPKDGFDHLAFFSPVNASEPIWITEGDWGEVTEISGVDESTGTVYFTAAAPSVDRHLFAAQLPTSLNLIGYDNTRKALTDTSMAGYYESSFSPKGKYYELKYRGPEVPWQRVVETADEGINQLLEGNAKLNETLAEFVKPIVTRTTLNSDGYDLNMMTIFPHNMDTSGGKKYPVLIQVYGGPGSQMVHSRFERDWQTYLATTLKIIVVRVDGRGTGFKGRKLRNPVVDDLGHWEVVDQIAAAREMISRRYVDASRVGIWGWSYGGYMTCKTIEAKSGLFSLGMAVAPVTNWVYYDSIYTERYMSTPDINAEGYARGAVNNVTAFQDVDFLLAHGSGDDNVHYMNSAALLDKFTQGKVRGWRFRMFTDSNHAMDRRGANREIYEWMTDFLKEKWGRGGTPRHGPAK